MELKNAVNATLRNKLPGFRNGRTFREQIFTKIIDQCTEFKKPLSELHKFI